MHGRRKASSCSVVIVEAVATVRPAAKKVGERALKRKECVRNKLELNP